MSLSVAVHSTRVVVINLTQFRITHRSRGKNKGCVTALQAEGRKFNPCSAHHSFPGFSPKNQPLAAIRRQFLELPAVTKNYRFLPAFTGILATNLTQTLKRAFRAPSRWGVVILTLSLAACHPEPPREICESVCVKKDLRDAQVCNSSSGGGAAAGAGLGFLILGPLGAAAGAAVGSQSGESTCHTESKEICTELKRECRANPAWIEWAEKEGRL